MDPLSVTASIVAILQLTNKVIGYLNDVKDAAKERALCAIQISNLYSLLTTLRFRLQDEDNTSPWYTAIRALTVENGPLDQFKGTLELLQSRMTNGASRFGRLTETLVWKFKKDEIDRMLQSIERLKSLVGIALQMDHFKLSQAIKKDTSAIKVQLTSIEEGVESLRLKHGRQHCDELGRWLSDTNFGAQQSDIIRRRRDGTGQWFLDSPEFMRWVDATSSDATLLCTGIPGAGKTMLAAVAVDHLRKSVRKGNQGVAAIYCSYKSRNEQTTEALLAAILQQLIQPECPHVVEMVTTLRDQFLAPSTRPKASELEQVLRKILGQFTAVHVIIDALDECSTADGTRRRFLGHLRELQGIGNLRILVTTRHIPDIVQAFHGTPAVEIRARREDVKMFLAGEIDRLPRCVQSDPALQKMVQDKIVEAIDGMFLLARLYIDSLVDKRTKSKVYATLTAISTGTHMLTDAYKDALKRLKSQLPGDSTLAMQILTYLVHAKSAITTAELCHALAVEPGQCDLDSDNLVDCEDMVSVCAGLVVIDTESNIIRLVHQTTQEYFESIQSEWSPNGQLIWTQTCLTYLAFDVFKEGSCATDDDLQRRLEHYPLLDYAALNWGTHARKVQSQVADLAGSILLEDGLTASMLQAAAAPLRRNRRKHYSQYFPKGRTGLHAVAELGLADLAAHIIARFDGDVITWINKRDSKGCTPLFLASTYGHHSVVQLLLESGADPNIHGDEFDYAYIAATLAHQNEAAKLSLEQVIGANVDQGDMRHAIHVAFGENYRKMVLTFGIALAEPRRPGPFWLHKASINGWNYMVRSSLSRGIDSSLENTWDWGWSPLYAACMYDNLEVVKLLLVNGATVKLLDDHVWQPIYAVAAMSHGYKFMQLLIQYGADVNVTEGLDGSALQRASRRGSLDIVQLILDHGALVDSPDTFDRTALDWAARFGRLNIVELLIDRGATINTRNKWALTPLHNAAQHSHLETVQCLLDKGADPQLLDNGRRTAIWAASFEGHIDIVRELLNRGANPMLPDSAGWLPLTIAADFRHIQIVELLFPHIPDFSYVSGSRGSFLVQLTRLGCLNLLRRAQVEYKANLRLIDDHGRNLLHIAARHGQCDLYSFLMCEDIELISTDAIGDDLHLFAASSGSIETCNFFLSRLPLAAIREQHWSPLHWACRAGKVSVIERLVQAGLKGYKVKVPQSDDTWSPLDIAAFHGHEASMVDLSEAARNALGPRANTHHAKRLHKDVKCDGCDHPVFGMRFQCRKCQDFDYCFMCKPFWEHLHPDHGWNTLDPPARETGSKYAFPEFL